MRLFRSILILMLVTAVAPSAVLGWVLYRHASAELAESARALAAERAAGRGEQSAARTAAPQGTAAPSVAPAPTPPGRRPGGLLGATIAAGVVASILAVSLSAWFARSLARPVSECVRGALDIARGRFGRQVLVAPRNEVGELAYTFNHMSRELQSYDRENRQLIAALEAGYLATLRSLASAIDAKDPSTHGHSQRVAELAVSIGQELGLGDDELKALAYGGLLHDIGKIGVAESILQKAGALEPEEMARMRAHPAIGAEILKGVEFLKEALPAVRSHHERWDGQGYPDGLDGDRIPLVARIVNAADTFDACTSPRPYQSAMAVDDALHVLTRARGRQIDPVVCDALTRIVQRTAEDAAVGSRQFASEETRA